MIDHNHTDDDPPLTAGSRAWRIFWSVLKLTTLLVCMGILIGFGASTGYVASLVRDEPIRSYDEIYEKVFSNDQTGFAYFRDQTLIGKLRTQEDRILVKENEVSPYLVQAIIAAEDKRFYEHRGVDVNGLSRAVFETITGSPVQTGGSTLTQQLIKQTILGTEVTHERKAKEIFLALRMERMFSKEQILDAYINKMYFGKSVGGTNIYGVQAAAKGIFGVDAKNLNIPQAAYIAGMLQAPSRYIPFETDGLKAGKERQKVVLDRMLENQFITQQQYKESIQYDIYANLAKDKNLSKAYSTFPYLMMEIEERAARVLVDLDIQKDPELKAKLTSQQYRELLDNKRAEVLRGGYHIYTTIDQDIHEMMTSIAEDPKNFGKNRTYRTNSGTRVENALEEVGATLIDNKTGAVLGFIGGRDFKVSQVNHSSRPRQPGSAMKPIGAYAPAFEKGLLQPGSIIEDEKIALENGAGNPPFYPSNYDGRFHGSMTVREALAKSYNIPAIKAYLEVGIPEALSYAERMGITTLVTPKDNPRRNDYQAKTGVIGGLTQGVTVEEITSAYSTFANQGVFLDSYLIQKITDAEGNPIFEHVSKPQKVYSPQTAYLMTDIMRTVVKSGTAASLKKYVGSRPDIAGKTGTTNDDYDSWFVAYTPEVSLGVWVGYDIPHSLPKYQPPRPIRIWGNIMSQLYEMDPERFPKDSTFDEPSGIVSAWGEIYNQQYVPVRRPAPEKKVVAEEPKSEEDSEKNTETEKNPSPAAEAKPAQSTSEQPVKNEETNTDKKASNSTQTDKKSKPVKESKPKNPDKPAKSQPNIGEITPPIDPLEGIIPPDPTR